MKQSPARYTIWIEILASIALIGGILHNEVIYNACLLVTCGGIILATLFFFRNLIKIHTNSELQKKKHSIVKVIFRLQALLIIGIIIQFLSLPGSKLFTIMTNPLVILSIIIVGYNLFQNKTDRIFNTGDLIRIIIVGASSMYIHYVYPLPIF